MIRKALLSLVFASLCNCAFEDSAEVPPASPTPPSGAESAPAAPGFDDGGDDLSVGVRMLRPTPVDSVEALPGAYYRPFALPGQIGVLSLERLDSDGRGDYGLFRSCGVPTCIGETGRFRATAGDASIGSATLELIAAPSAAVTDRYRLDALWRDADDRIVALQLRRELSGGITGAPFLLFAMPADDAALPAPSLPPTTDAAGDPRDDLPGVYVRALPPYGEVGAVTLGEPVWSDAVGVGDYQAAVPYCLPWCFPETGTYRVTLEAPLIGAGELELIPAGNPGAVRRYRIDAIWRTPIGGIGALQLQRRYGAGLVGLPFLMYRQWWTTPAGAPAAPDPIVSLADELEATELIEHGDLEPEIAAALVAWRAERGLFRSRDEVADAASGISWAAASGLCAYYRGLQEYYAIRALQCAYSICYPLSPWYGFWADYYARLAESACGDEDS